MENRTRVKITGVSIFFWVGIRCVLIHKPILIYNFITRFKRTVSTRHFYSHVIFHFHPYSVVYIRTLCETRRNSRPLYPRLSPNIRFEVVRVLPTPSTAVQDLLLSDHLARHLSSSATLAVVTQTEPLPSAAESMPVLAYAYAFFSMGTNVETHTSCLLVFKRFYTDHLLHRQVEQ